MRICQNESIQVYNKARFAVGECFDWMLAVKRTICSFKYYLQTVSFTGKSKIKGIIAPLKLLDSWL